MKHLSISLLAVFAALALLLSGCASAPEEDLPPENESTPGYIYIYGERHGSKYMYEKEVVFWQELYAQGARHLFVEFGYCTAQYLNLWMKADSDEILDLLCEGWRGTSMDNEYARLSFVQIKETCPETVFHGTDVGHQYATTGASYLSYLEEQGLRDSEEYALALECIQQGETFYATEDNDYVYRENKMVENFIREYETVYDETIMGIYGEGHVDPDGLTTWAAEEIPCMANQLMDVYGDRLICTQIISLIKGGS